MPKPLEILATLRDSEPLVWRRLLLNPELNLIALHHILQVAFQLQNVHLWEFRIAGETYSLESTDGAQAPAQRCLPPETAVVVALGKCIKAEYRYDFADDWVIDLDFRRAVHAQVPFAVVEAGEMRGPLEGVGGIVAHNELVTAVMSNGVAENELEHWVPPAYQPAIVQLKEVNARLAFLGDAFDAGFDLEAAFNEDESYDDESDEDDEELEEEALLDALRDGSIDSASLQLGYDLQRLGVPLGLVNFPQDDCQQPVMYDANDVRGPEPERWSSLTHQGQIESVLAYHQLCEDSESTSELHAELHVLVERHLMSGLYATGQALIPRLARRGWPRHAVLHLLSQALAVVAQFEGASLDEVNVVTLARYTKKLTIKAVDTWLDGGELPEVIS